MQKIIKNFAKSISGRKLCDIVSVIRCAKGAKKSAVMVVGGGCLLLCAAYYFFVTKPNNSKNTQDNVKIVEVEDVKLGSISKDIEYIGTIKAIRETTLAAKAGGGVFLRAKSGAKVTKGQLIAEIANSEIEDTYNLAKQAMNLAKIQFERAKALSASNLSSISKNNLDEKHVAMLSAQKQLIDAQIAIDNLKIYAPFDGKLGVFKVKDYDEISSGWLIVDIYDFLLEDSGAIAKGQKMLLEFEIAPELVEKSRPKDTTDAMSLVFKGKEYEFYAQELLDPETGMCSSSSYVECENCISGSSVNLSIRTQKKHDVVVIDRSSLFLKGMKYFVYVVKDDKTVLVPVSLGIINKNKVEITSGLSAGDKLISYGHERLYPGQDVKIHNHSP